MRVEEGTCPLGREDTVFAPLHCLFSLVWMLVVFSERPLIVDSVDPLGELVGIRGWRRLGFGIIVC